MKTRAMVKGVGKFKAKFNQTGFLLDAGKGEFWANMPGNLSYKDYKDKEFTFDLAQDDKGYWSGTIEGGGAATGGDSRPAGNKDRLIVAQVVYKRLADKFDTMHEFDVYLMGNLKVFKRHIDAIMQAGSDELPMPKGGDVNPEYSDNPEPTDESDNIPF